ncbi:hypothetical protein QW131_17590 [Roseibium salinum]|nr:hypothetical protein [Roseibium salinum]
MFETDTLTEIEAGTALDKTTLSASGNVTVSADGDFELFALAGGVAFGFGGSAVGISSVVLVHLDNVKADVKGHASIVTDGAIGLKIEATSTDDVTTVAAAGSGSGSGAAIAGSVAVTVLDETTIANLGANSSVNALNGSNDPGVRIYAEDETDILTISGSLAISAGGAGARCRRQRCDAHQGDGSESRFQHDHRCGRQCHHRGDQQ